MSKNFSILNKTRGKTPRIPFGKIKDKILGKEYELSLALVTPKEARSITRKTKKKDTPSNVLSFPLSKKSGEIIICPATARKQTPTYGVDYRTFMAHLFIHGATHLAGYTHSATMDREESRIASLFGF